MEASLIREEQGPTRHEDEMDGDKASALDVYLRFKLFPRSERRNRKKSSADFSLESLDSFDFPERKSRT